MDLLSYIFSLSLLLFFFFRTLPFSHEKKENLCPRKANQLLLDKKTCSEASNDDAANQENE